MGCEIGNDLISSWPYVKYFVDFILASLNVTQVKNWTRRTNIVCFLLAPYFGCLGTSTFTPFVVGCSV